MQPLLTVLEGDGGGGDPGGDETWSSILQNTHEGKWSTYLPSNRLSAGSSISTVAYHPKAQGKQGVSALWAQYALPLDRSSRKRVLRELKRGDKGPLASDSDEYSFAVTQVTQPSKRGLDYNLSSVNPTPANLELMNSIQYPNQKLARRIRSL